MKKVKSFIKYVALFVACNNHVIFDQKSNTVVIFMEKK